MHEVTEKRTNQSTPWRSTEKKNSNAVNVDVVDELQRHASRTKAMVMWPDILRLHLQGLVQV